MTKAAGRLARTFHQGSRWLERNGLTRWEVCASVQQTSAIARSAVAACACLFPFIVAAGPQPENDLEQAFYDISVIGYCGLSSEPVSTGFHREVERITTRDGIDETQLRDARSRALTLVELEWANRGLGGFRAWCRTEGQAAVERFIAIPR